jgi:hypothetical protein
MQIYDIFYECKFMSEGAWILLPLVLQKRIFAKLPFGIVIWNCIPTLSIIFIYFGKYGIQSKNFA